MGRSGAVPAFSRPPEAGPDRSDRHGSDTETTHARGVRANPPRRGDEGGGGGVHIPRAPVAAALAGLAAFLAAPAAAECESTPAGAGTLPEATYDGTYTTQIHCRDVSGSLEGGLTLTVGPDARVGAEGDPVEDDAVEVNATVAGANAVSVVNSGSLYTDGRGIDIVRKGSGMLRVEHRDGGRIVSDGSSDDGGGGILAAHEGQADTVTKGIHVISAGDIDISKAPNSGKIGIEVTTVDAPATSTVPVRVEVRGGRIDMGDSGATPEYGVGVTAFQYVRGDIDVTVGPGAWIGGNGKHGVHAQLQSASVGNITVTHEGRIHSIGAGIYGVGHSTSTAAGTGDITVRTAPGSEIRAAINPLNTGYPARGVDVTIYSTAGVGDITVVHNGLIESGHEGIFAANFGTGDITVETGETGRIVTTGTRSGTGGYTKYVMGIDASLRGTGRDGDITVTHRGAITAGDEGIAAVIGGSVHDYLNTESTRDTTSNGTIGVTTAKGSRVASESDGIFVWHNGGGDAAGQGTFGVTVRGRVTGGGEGYAGIHIAAKGDAKGKGGTVTVGPRAYVGAGSGVAVRVDANAGPVAVVLERDRYGLAGHVEGTVLNPAATAFSARTGEDGAATALKVGDRVDMRGETTGVHDAVHRTRLETVTGGHEFKKLSETRIYHDRARVYEALPSVLLDLVRPASLAGRASVTRDGAAATRGTAGGGGRVWARLEASDGKRRAAASTTGKGYRGVALAWDTEHRSVEAGLELPAGDRLALGLGVRHLRGRATVRGGGRIDVSGLGLGLSVAHTGGSGLYIDGRLSHTRFGDIDLASDARGSVVSNLSGDGFAAGVGVGRRIAREGVALTPRGGLAWSSVSLGAFDDVAGVEGGGRVVPGRTRSLVGGLGVLAEFGGSEGSSGRAFASLDLEHEFSPDREVVASGTGLSSKVRATWLRLGLGGALDLGSSGAVRLSGRGHYATAGSGNTGYGGSVTLSLSF